MHLAFITGRTPELSYKEIEATATTLPFQWSLSMVQAGVCVLKQTESTEKAASQENSLQSQIIQNLQKRLGGTQKIVLLQEHVDQNKLPAFLFDLLNSIETPGRLTFGLSVHGKGVSAMRVGLELKKLLKKEGRSVRFVTPTDGEMLSTAQVLGNKLTDADGIELVIIKENTGWWVGRTLTVQDIASYRKRDFDIPVPDPVSGMLSPKLAQAMINLAIGDSQDIVYDPFCGNGRVVEEARLMGLVSYGSDILEKQVEASRKNLAWIASEYNLELESSPKDLLFQQDATKIGAEKYLTSFIGAKKWHIVSEPYLGRPLRQPLTQSEQGPWLAELATLYLGFLGVWSKAALKPESMLVVFPKAACQGGNSLSLFDHLVDRLAGFGYSAVQVSDYGRPDAFVRRELVRISSK